MSLKIVILVVLAAIRVFAGLLLAVPTSASFYGHLAFLPILAQLGNFFIQFEKSLEPLPVEAASGDRDLNRAP